MLVAPFKVLLDANVLYPLTLRDTLLREGETHDFKILRAGHQTSICSTNTEKARSMGTRTRTLFRTTASSTIFAMLLSSLR